MKCPNCGSDKTRVYETRKYCGANLRRRLCEACGRRFSSTETADDATTKHNTEAGLWDEKK